MVKKVLFPLLFLVFAYFVLHFESAKEIIAGVAIFLVGMIFLEEGFKLFSGGLLEKILEKFTNSLPKGILNGFLITSVVQSSSLTSVILISFLGTGIIALESAIYVLLGSSLGSSTTAWLISLFGLKIKISHYAMPIIIFGIIFRFSKNLKYKGLGNILLGIGFIFLGISYMVTGFYDLKDSVDLSIYSNSDFFTMLLFAIIGAFMTFVVQSSSASIAIILTALASSQVLYLNAIALVIGGKIGSSATTILGSLSSNSNGKRLAAFQLVLNILAALLGVVLFFPILEIIDTISNYFSITSDVIKLTIFVTIFNLLSVLVIIPIRSKIILKLNTLFKQKVKSWSKLEYLDSSSLESSKSIISGLKKENIILYSKLIKAIKHLFLINEEDKYWSKKYKDKKSPQNKEIDKIYKEKIKSLHDEIVEFISFVPSDLQKNDLKIINNSKILSSKIYSYLKSAKHLEKIIEDGLESKNRVIKNEYIAIKELFALSINELENIAINSSLDDIDKLFKVKALQQKLILLDKNSSHRLDKLYEEKELNAQETTKIIKDNSTALLLCQKLIDITISLTIENRLLLDLQKDEDEI